MTTSLGDRMKQSYEDRYRFSLPRRTPVAIRVDGRAFHTFTRGMAKPFDQAFIDSMVTAAIAVAKEMQGFKVGYVQSDEASFILTDYDDINTEAWFDYNKSKMETIAASLMTAHFNKALLMARESDGKTVNDLPTAIFDGRAWSLPEAEISNYLLWRAQDWKRNSLNMYCLANFSHKQLLGKNEAARHELLYTKGKNWANDCTPQQKNGTWLWRGESGIETGSDFPASYEPINLMVTLVLLRGKEKAAAPTS